MLTVREIAEYLDNNLGFDVTARTVDGLYPCETVEVTRSGGPLRLTLDLDPTDRDYLLGTLWHRDADGAMETITDGLCWFLGDGIADALDDVVAYADSRL